MHQFQVRLSYMLGLSFNHIWTQMLHAYTVHVQLTHRLLCTEKVATDGMQHSL